MAAAGALMGMAERLTAAANGAPTEAADTATRAAGAAADTETRAATASTPATRTGEAGIDKRAFLLFVANSRFPLLHFLLAM